MALLRPRSLSSLPLRRRRRPPTTPPNTGTDNSNDEANGNESGFAAFDTDIIRSLDRLELVDGLKDLITTERERFREALRKRSHHTQRIRKKWEAQRRKMQERLKSPDFIAFKDKASFVLGLGALLITEAILMKSPEYMWAWYAVLIGPLLITRYVLYRKVKFQYFCYDLCYFMQATLCLALFTPLGRSLTFHRVNFAMANGPLAFAVAVWGNSMVFHSLDKQTSLFIHLLPPVVTYSLRWHGSQGLPYITNDSPYSTFGDSAKSDILSGFFVAPMVMYIVWQALYLVKTEIISREKLQNDEQIMTSKRWLTKSQKGLFYKIINCCGPQWQTWTFVALQLVYTVVTLLPSVLMYRSQIANALILLAMLFCSLWNGARFYFEVFASRYINELQKIRESFDREFQGDQDPQNDEEEGPSSGNSWEGSSDSAGASRSDDAASENFDSGENVENGENPSIS